MPATTRKILLLFAHPAQERSEINCRLFERARNTVGVTAVDLYAQYPTLYIDVTAEQHRLIEHDILIFQFPFYWYSTPPILKVWQDLVLEYGFAYGSSGDKLTGKTFLCATSTGAPEQSYQHDGFNRFTLRELLRPLEQTANCCRMIPIAPFVIHSSRTAVDEGRMQAYEDEWQRLLNDLVENRIDLQTAATLPKLNGFLNRLSGQ